MKTEEYVVAMTWKIAGTYSFNKASLSLLHPATRICRYALHCLCVNFAAAVPSQPRVTYLGKMQDKHDLLQKAESKNKEQQSSKVEGS